MENLQNGDGFIFKEIYNYSWKDTVYVYSTLQK